MVWCGVVCSVLCVVCSVLYVVCGALCLVFYALFICVSCVLLLVRCLLLMMFCGFCSWVRMYVCMYVFFMFTDMAVLDVRPSVIEPLVKYLDTLSPPLSYAEIAQMNASVCIDKENGVERAELFDLHSLVSTRSDHQSDAVFDHLFADVVLYYRQNHQNNNPFHRGLSVIRLLPSEEESNTVNAFRQLELAGLVQS